MSPSDVVVDDEGGGEGFGVVIDSAASLNAYAAGIGAAEEKEIALFPYCYNTTRPSMVTSWTMV